MELARWWVLPLVAAAALVTGFALRRRAARRSRDEAGDARAQVANSDLLTALPGYGRALARYRGLLRAACVLLIGLVAGAALLAARPIGTDTVAPDTRSRDIVLCLDVSNSMATSDVALLDTFMTLVGTFTSERVGLVLFASSPVQVFPLTDDYAYVTEQLTAVRDAYGSGNTGSQAWAGTTLGEGTSVISDGLATCLTSFDRPRDRRPRSVVLATDNYAAGPQRFTLEDTARIAITRNIRVYGLNPEDPTGSASTPEAASYQATMRATAGEYFGLDDPTQVPRIVAAIGAEESARFTGAPRLVQFDQPGVVVGVVALALLGYLALMWRVRR